MYEELRRHWRLAMIRPNDSYSGIYAGPSLRCALCFSWRLHADVSTSTGLLYPPRLTARTHRLAFRQVYKAGVSCCDFNAHPTQFSSSPNSHRPSHTNWRPRHRRNRTTRRPSRCTSHPAQRDRSRATTYDTLLAHSLAPLARLDITDDVRKIVPTCAQTFEQVPQSCRRRSFSTRLASRPPTQVQRTT